MGDRIKPCNVEYQLLVRMKDQPNQVQFLDRELKSFVKEHDCLSCEVTADPTSVPSTNTGILDSMYLIKGTGQKCLVSLKKVGKSLADLGFRKLVIHRIETFKWDKIRESFKSSDVFLANEKDDEETVEETVNKVVTIHESNLTKIFKAVGNIFKKGQGENGREV